MSSIHVRGAWRLALLYWVALLLALGVLAVLIASASAEFIDYVPIVVAFFGLPWSSLALVADSRLPDGVAFALLLLAPLLNTATLYYVGQRVSRDTRTGTPSDAAS